jgi:hypothetical protein
MINKIVHEKNTQKQKMPPKKYWSTVKTCSSNEGNYWAKNMAIFHAKFMKLAGI